MRYVLFVCTHNAGRSQIAQAFFEKYAPPDLRAESASQAPAEAIWPNVVEAMREVGLDISARKPKKIEVEMQLHADRAITLNCQGSCPYVLGGVEDWKVDDPAGQPLEIVREIRDEIERRVHDLIENRADEIRADRSGHDRRLAGFYPRWSPTSRMREAARRSAPAPTRSWPNTTTRPFARSCSRWPSGASVTACMKPSARCSPKQQPYRSAHGFVVPRSPGRASTDAAKAGSGHRRSAINDQSHTGAEGGGSP